MSKMTLRVAALAVSMSAALAVGPLHAQQAPSVIKLGQTMPYSGPASTYAVIGRAEAAYFKMVNDKGGINGRKVELISLDDGFAPPKTVEQTRRLVESEGILAAFGSFGTVTNIAVAPYLNQRKVPQLFVASGGVIWNDRKKYPWSMGWMPDYETEGAIFAKYTLENMKDPKIAILYQNDDSGKDYARGFRQGLGDRANKLIVAESSYNFTDVNVDTQILSFQQAGANVFFTHANPKTAAQTIQKMSAINWRPHHLLVSVASTIGGTLKPAGLEKAQGIISAFYTMDASDRMTRETEDYKEYKAFLDKYAPDLDPNEGWVVFGYISAQLMEKVLQQAGDDLSRENVMKQARNFKISPRMILPGITVSTSEAEGKTTPVTAMRLGRFEGENWVLFGDAIDTNR